MRKNNGDNQQFESHDVSDEALENISGGAAKEAPPTATPVNSLGGNTTISKPSAAAEASSLAGAPQGSAGVKSVEGMPGVLSPIVKKL